jgi:hypothetical protein
MRKEFVDEFKKEMRQHEMLMKIKNEVELLMIKYKR